MSTATTVFNATEYIQKANEKEAAARTPGLAPIATRTVDPTPAATEPEGQTPKLPSSVRRELNRLRVQLGEAQGELKILREIKVPEKSGEKTGEKATEVVQEAAGEPQRAKFPAGAVGDVDFTKALAKYTTDQTNAVRDQQAATAQRIKDMGAKCEEDFKLIPDWKAHAKDAEENGPEIKWDAPENYQFSMLLGTSEYQAMALDYYATHPDELQEIVAMKGVAQIAEFRALEGHLKREYSKLKKQAATPAGQQTDGKGEKKEVKPAEAARTKLPQPSESVAARGGSAPPTEVSPYLADGKTINPAWKEMRNQKERGR